MGILFMQEVKKAWEQPLALRWMQGVIHNWKEHLHSITRHKTIAIFFLMVVTTSSKTVSHTMGGTPFNRKEAAKAIIVFTSFFLTCLKRALLIAGIITNSFCLIPPLKKRCQNETLKICYRSSVFDDHIKKTALRRFV